MIDGKAAIERMLAMKNPRPGANLETLWQAYDTPLTDGHPVPSALEAWAHVTDKHRTRDDMPAGVPVFFATPMGTGYAFGDCGISVDRDLIAIPHAGRILTMTVAQYLDNVPNSRFIGWAGDIFGHVVKYAEPDPEPELEDEDDRGERITEIQGFITTADGKTREFRITPDSGYQQWGADTETLGNTVNAVSAIQDKLSEEGVL